jgi:hypothetical protein
MLTLQPTVDGPWTIKTYLGALDAAYSTFNEKAAASKARQAKKISLASVQAKAVEAATSVANAASDLLNGNTNGAVAAVEDDREGINKFDYVCLHSYVPTIRLGRSTDNLVHTESWSRRDTHDYSTMITYETPTTLLSQTSHPRFRVWQRKRPTPTRLSRKHSSPMPLNTTRTQSYPVQTVF